MKEEDPKLPSFREEAILTAQRIIEGTMDPHQGCDHIGAICSQNNYPKELIEFEHLSHLQTGHESLGFNKQNLREGIIEEARKLLELNKTEPGGIVNDGAAPHRD